MSRSSNVIKCSSVRTEKAKYYCEGQLCFFNEAELEYNKGAKEPTPETIHVAAHDRKQKRSKEDILAGIEHREVVIRLDQSERICKNCGTELTVIGKEFIRSQIEIIPEQVYIVDVYAETYKCAECEKKTDSRVLCTEDTSGESSDRMIEKICGMYRYDDYNARSRDSRGRYTDDYGHYPMDTRWDRYFNRMRDGLDDYSAGRSRYRDGGSNERMVEGIEMTMGAIVNFIESLMDMAETS